MRKLFYTLVMLAVSSMSVIACVQDKNPKGQNNDSKEQSNMKENKKVLVAYFSRTGENYSVGNIVKGNTHIVAELIAGETGGDLFQIEPVVVYPDNYDVCVELAKKELNAKARPAVKGDVRVEDYDVIFIGYPNWWGDMPMPVYTFIEKHDWHGKTVVPFCTHEGSGLGSTASRLQSACQGAKVLNGLSVYGHTAQNNRRETEQATHNWLESLQY